MAGEIVHIADPVHNERILTVNADGTLPTSASGNSAITATDGAIASIGATTDASTALTVIGRLKKLLLVLPSALGQLTMANSLSVTLASDQGNLGVSQAKQTTVTDTLQNGVTSSSTTNGAVSTTDGYDGALMLFIANGAGTCTVTLQGSLDAAFTTAQDALTLGVSKISDSGAGTNTTRTVLSGAIAVAANTSYLFSVVDAFPNMRAVISSGSNLGAGTSDTGCTVKLYKVAT